MSEEEFKGLLGESLIDKLLNDNIDVYKKVLRDVTITVSDKKTQIDNILITTKGIYVIESKNFNSLLIVNDKNEWFYYKGKTAVRIMNSPYEQNKYHIQKLSEKLNLENKYFKSIIVLGYYTTKDVKFEYPDCVVVNIQELCDYIINDFLKNEDIFTHEQIDTIYMLIKHSN